MTMHTKIQKEKLWQSVEHYLENWQDPDRADIRATACACCREWVNNNCVGCPIMQHTGKDDCDGTPWHAIYDALNTFGETTEVVQDLLEKEYRFLVELALEPYEGAEGEYTVQFEEGRYLSYGVYLGKEEIARYHTKWAALIQRNRWNSAAEAQVDGGTQ